MNLWNSQQLRETWDGLNLNSKCVIEDFLETFEDERGGRVLLAIADFCDVTSTDEPSPFEAGKKSVYWKIMASIALARIGREETIED